MTAASPGRPRLEIWGGIECTVNRVGDRYGDQLERSGHAARPGDLDAFAALGIDAIRYPLLWERIAPAGLARADWGWADERMARLRALGLRPIVGLVHHGSGPRHVSLVDDAFADGLAEYARAVAARYPWVEDFTPVNEPLTTARFSGLYGLWYPHGRDEATFVRAVLVQCRAVARAMRAIREVTPAARLVQTEDLGRTGSTPALAYQAAFENERRWLSFDLLCGRVRGDHRMAHHLRWLGLDDRELEAIAAEACPPDVLGINHYVTSERWLDEDLAPYPPWTHGDNGRVTYADVEAVRVRGVGLAGPGGVLAEAWERYRVPLAVTEAHMGCTRDEQLRWLTGFWDAAARLRDDGVDLRAVTAWALLGAYDWDSLLTRPRGHYEPGVFDVRAPRPRPTALARAVRRMSAGRRPDHPVLDSPGWWARPDRIQFPSPDAGPSPAGPGTSPGPQARAPRPLLVTGAGGTLGRAFARACGLRGLAHQAIGRDTLDIADPESVDRALDHFAPWAVVNAAGYVRVDDAEREVERCRRENALGPGVLAAACARHGVALVTFSSDLVFDGARGEPYVESDRVRPLSVYGRSKAEAESRVLAAMPHALVVRTSAFFGPWDEHNFVTLALRSLAAGRPFAAAEDLVVSATYVPDLVDECLDLLVDGEHGVWHLATHGPVTWVELARRAAECVGVPDRALVSVPGAALGHVAPRPAYSALTSERASVMQPLDHALGRYARECVVGGIRPALPLAG